MSPGPRVFVSAGEPSGDAHAADVVRALRVHWPDAEVHAFGGPALEAAGARVRFSMESYTVLGLVEVIEKLPAHVRLLGQLGQEFRTGRYDLVILVDYPGFNLRLGRAARRAGVRTLYYVAPQLWAWRPGRARLLRAAADRVAAILPFEPAFFADYGIASEFVGHPLVERHWPTREAAREHLGIDPAERVLALLPGSRTQEIRRIWPTFRETALHLLRESRCDRVIAAGRSPDAFPDPGGIGVFHGVSDAVLAAADAALVKSGTITLEAAMVGTPMAVAYRVHPATALVARRVMRVPWVSLVNLVAGREIVPELLQRQATPEALAAAVTALLDPANPARQRQYEALAEVRARLGTPGAAERVGEIARDLLAA